MFYYRSCDYDIMKYDHVLFKLHDEFSLNRNWRGRGANAIQCKRIQHIKSKTRCLFRIHGHRMHRKLISIQRTSVHVHKIILYFTRNCDYSVYHSDVSLIRIHHYWLYVFILNYDYSLYELTWTMDVYQRLSWTYKDKIN